MSKLAKFTLAGVVGSQLGGLASVILLEQAGSSWGTWTKLIAATAIEFTSVYVALRFVGAN